MYTKKKKPINMATGGLMSMPPFIAKQEDDKDKGISPYDINTPADTLPSVLIPASIISTPEESLINSIWNLSKFFFSSLTKILLISLTLRLLLRIIFSY